MIVYNFHAVIIAIILFIVNYLLGFISEELQDFTGPYYWLIALFISSSFEAYGWRPKIYLVPLGIVIKLITLYLLMSEFGFNGLIGGALYVTIVFIGIILIQHQLFLKKWDILNREIRNAQTSTEEFNVFPMHFYPNNLLNEKYFSFVYDFFLVKWFKKDTVKSYFLALINRLDVLHENDEKYASFSSYFKAQLDEPKPLIAEHLLESLAVYVETEKS